MGGDHMKKRRGSYVRKGTPSAGPVTIRRADGTVEQRESLKGRQVENAVRRGDRKPRTWDER